MQNKLSLFVFFGSTKIVVALAKDVFKPQFYETWINSAEPKCLIMFCTVCL